MKKIIDISVPVHSNMPLWPGSTSPKLTQTSSIDGSEQVNVSRLSCDVHIGTHVDAPLHYIEHGSSVEQMPLDVLIGPAFVAYLPGIKDITADILAGLSLPEGTKRLLLRTDNSSLWEQSPGEFRADYAALTLDAAKWVVEQGICLIGIDYLSVQRYYDDPETHKILLGEGIIIVEGLYLFDVAPGLYELICLPLKLVGSEGAPARAVLQYI